MLEIVKLTSHHVLVCGKSNPDEMDSNATTLYLMVFKIVSEGSGDVHDLDHVSVLGVAKSAKRMKNSL